MSIFCLFPFGQISAGEGVENIQQQLSQTEVTINKGTEFQTKPLSDLNMKNCHLGKEVDFVLAADFIVDNQIIFPRGTLFKGIITDLSKYDLLSDNFNVIIEINSISGLLGKLYAVKAHPELNIVERKKRKGSWLRFMTIDNPTNNQEKYTNNKIENVIKSDNDKYERTYNNKDTGENTGNNILQKSSTVKIILDEDMTVKLKKF